MAIQVVTERDRFFFSLDEWKKASSLNEHQQQAIDQIFNVMLSDRKITELRRKEELTRISIELTIVEEVRKKLVNIEENTPVERLLIVPKYLTFTLFHNSQLHAVLSFPDAEKAPLEDRTCDSWWKANYYWDTIFISCEGEVSMFYKNWVGLGSPWFPWKDPLIRIQDLQNWDQGEFKE